MHSLHFFHLFIGTNTDFIWNKYDTIFFGSSESWPQSTYLSPKWNALDATSSNNFATWGGWGDNNPHYTYSSALFTHCNNNANFDGYVFGGYNIFGSNIKVHKSFINVPTHYKVDVSLNMYFVDSWDSEEFYVDVDSTRILSVQSQNFAVNGLINRCGREFDDQIEEFNLGSTSHSASSMTIYFSCSLNQALDDESFGFKDLIVYLYNYCHYSCVTCSVFLF